MLSRNSKNLTLAIDLGTDAIRLVDVAPERDTIKLRRFAEQAVPEGPAETLPERHLALLGELVSQHRLSHRNAVAAMPSSLVFTRTVQVDSAKPQSAEEQIIKTLQNCLPFDSKDLSFDCWPVSTTAGQARHQEILVVATQASVVRKYLAGFEKLSLRCVHLDVAPCAVASLLQHTAETPGAVMGAVALTRNGGFFAIAERGNVLFWRPFDFSSTAGRAMHANGLNLERIGDEISKCVSHMVGAIQVDALSELLLFGHGTAQSTLSDYLNQRFRLPVRAPSPFDLLSAGDAALPDAQAATHYCTAVGLALQDFQGAAVHG
jgi:Tfp pilus assembly PilM family ATPase